MNLKLKAELDKIREEFIISNMTLNKIANDFYNDMFEKKMLKMLENHINAKMDNVLADEYLAIDLGGSNIRISKLKISDDSVSIDKIIKIPLRGRVTDYTTNKYTLKDLFVMALKKIKPFLDKEKMYTLAATVSFGLISKSKSDVSIIELSKGFDLADTLGENVYKVLSDAIQEVNLKVIPTAIINDCVATMVTGKFFYPNADIALIVGTGHNACFINDNYEIINIESANFNKELPLTQFDRNFITKIPKESEQLLEVLIGGKYVGGIVNAIMKYLVENGFIKEYKCVESEEVIKILNGEVLLKYSTEQKEVISEIGKIIFERSAKLIVAEIAAILRFIDTELKNKHTVIFDGSVYEKCTFFREQISLALESFFLENANKLSHKLIKDASTVGPAIISASI